MSMLDDFDEALEWELDDWTIEDGDRSPDGQVVSPSSATCDR